MNKLFFAVICCINATHLNAQSFIEKLTLKKGEVFSVLGIDSSALTQKMDDQPMDMLTITSTQNKYEVIDVTKDGYRIKSTLTKILVDFKGYGMVMVYDSEDPKKQDPMLKEQMKTVVGKVDTMEIDMQGKLLEHESKKDKRGKDRGMMRMTDMQSSNIENMFLLIPSEAQVGKGWKTDNEKEGVKTQTIYFLDAISGDIAEISYKRKKKGIKAIKSPQGDMNMEVDNLSSGSIKVSISTGLIKMYNESVESKSKMNTMGKEIITSGKTKTTMGLE